MTLKSDAKLEEKLICCSKNDKNLVNFDLSTRNSWNFCFDSLLLSKVYNVWPKKKTEELCFMILKSDAKFEEKLTCGLENDMKQIFTRALESLKIGALKGSFYPN